MIGLQSLTYRILSIASLILEILYVAKIQIMDDFYASRKENPLQSRVFILLKICLTTKMTKSFQTQNCKLSLNLVDMIVAKYINKQSAIG